MSAAPGTPSRPLRVLATGGAGQVGTELRRLHGTPVLDAGGEALSAAVVALDRAGLDVTDAEAVARALDVHRPEAVVNAAAWTAVDRAETEREAAFAVNATGARVLAEACAARGVPLVHLSTDYVFDGTKGAPYAPSDPVTPVNVYGASKAAGEVAVRESGGEAAVLRTAWVLSGHSPGFVRTMLRLGAERAPGGPKAGEPLRVVADQWGHPTPAAAVAHAALQTAARLTRGTDAERAAARGTHHVAGEPLTTWHALAEAILVAAGLDVPVEAIPTSGYPTPARRPGQVRLDLAASRRALGLKAVHWREAVPGLVAEALGRDR